jgi:hypothetical protein
LSLSGPAREFADSYGSSTRSLPQKAGASSAPARATASRPERQRGPRWGDRFRSRWKRSTPAWWLSSIGGRLGAWQQRHREAHRSHP